MQRLIELMGKIPEIYGAMLSQPMGWFVLLVAITFGLAVMSLLERIWGGLKKLYLSYKQRKQSAPVKAYDWPYPGSEIPSDAKE
ncbi:MAG: hypothetical protein HXX08_13605 [Chloroflexi bacterium]|uniref:Uncharacterized protein n=1 Tax=Candidatus Chlorohelix allophototropha TaxID=3003348 RepID=A0A8T7M4A9_9CHLR|nr:hypothetical protein [Chloroflexota bacterium]WJW70114.1 hypothetical protein OZ401_004617 [Chloroflexota bacterium L227-S17]